ncbi:MAG: hypothetical protein P8Y09_12425 [Deltaproteobacteria bacterium]
MKIKITEDMAKFVSPKSPRNVRLMAAKGVMPLPPRDLIKILFILCFDRDAEIKKIAQGTFKDFSTNIIMDVIDGDLEPSVIDFLIRYHKERKKFVKNVILNKNTADDTIAYLAGAKSSAIVEMISQNQERISRSQKIFDALMQNPTLSVSSRERVREYKDGFEAVSIGVEVTAPADDGGDGGGVEVEPPAETTDSSKTVVAATIKSPKITEEEILNVAKSKQASDEAIRLITLYS